MEIVPNGTPSVIRSCPKCGSGSAYTSSGNFRVNANRNHIDVWLIYQCKKCNSTWNMEIFSRTDKNSIDKEQYLKYLRNDKELARQYAFDISSHRKNKSVISFENISYDIIVNPKAVLSYTDSFELELICRYPLNIRLDRLLSQGLGISREQIKRMCSTDSIFVKGAKAAANTIIKNGMVIGFNC
jgi:hypothetical protein